MLRKSNFEADEMRAVIQRVGQASVSIGSVRKASIGRGLLILLGVEDADTAEDVDWLARKIAALRVFDDEAGVMNLDLHAVGGEALVHQLHLQILVK